MKLKPLIAHLVRLLPLILIVVFGFFYFYHLGFTSLDSWDEGWYASIARDINQPRKIFLPEFDGEIFVDHPPLGIWLMATSFRVLGTNEFAARAPSAALGVLSIVLMLYIGEELFESKPAGYIAAIVLASSFWFVNRARSGNLDVPFIFFSLLTVYCALRARKKDVWLLAVGASFGALMLTKTLVGASMLLMIVYLLRAKIFTPNIFSKRSLAAVAVFLLVFLPWYVVNYLHNPLFLHRQIFNVAMRDRSASSFLKLQIQPALSYLQFGVGRWFKVFAASAVALAGLLVLPKKYRVQKDIIIFVLLWLVVIAFPFFTTDQTQIWHLLPLYPPIALIIAYACLELSKLIAHKNKAWGKGALILALIATTALAAFQSVQIFHTIVSKTKSISDEAKISQEAAKHTDGLIYLDEGFTPVAVFYSGHNVSQFATSRTAFTNLSDILKDPAKVVIVNKQTVLDLQQAKVKFEVLSTNQSYAVIDGK